MDEKVEDALAAIVNFCKGKSDCSVCELFSGVACGLTEDSPDCWNFVGKEGL